MKKIGMDMGHHCRSSVSKNLRMQQNVKDIDGMKVIKFLWLNFGEKERGREWELWSTKRSLNLVCEITYYNRKINVSQIEVDTQRNRK